MITKERSNMRRKIYIYVMSICLSRDEEDNMMRREFDHHRITLSVSLVKMNRIHGGIILAMRDINPSIPFS